MRLKQEIIGYGELARTASGQIVSLDEKQKNEILRSMATEINNKRVVIKKANKMDLEQGEKNGLSKAMLDRLELNDRRIDAMIQGIEDVILLEDQIGSIISENIRPNGLKIKKVRVPIGVIGIIYESRPNVTADAASLCIKSSNVVILKGGSEAINSNLAIGQAMQDGGSHKGLPTGAIQLIQSTDRNAVKELVQLDDYVDLIIPRGGEGLIRAIAEMARVPVLKHYKGVCHTYVDESADLEKALQICDNAKTQRPGVCNAMETLLVHQKIANTFLPRIASLFQEKGVEIRADKKTREVISAAGPATEDDWYAEYLDMILSVKIVSNVEEAISHINKYGSKHSDAIISENAQNKSLFTQNVDSATVYVNASTRFTDGGEFGMGAEMGISTDKLHARGPVGINELSTYKYIIEGDGQIRV
jgi:glutamate-5-semialdehyde dehydrogenase